MEDCRNDQQKDGNGLDGGRTRRSDMGQRCARIARHEPSRDDDKKQCYQIDGRRMEHGCRRQRYSAEVIGKIDSPQSGKEGEKQAVGPFRHGP